MKDTNQRIPEGQPIPYKVNKGTSLLEKSVKLQKIKNKDKNCKKKKNTQRKKEITFKAVAVRPLTNF